MPRKGQPKFVDGMRRDFKPMLLMKREDTEKKVAELGLQPTITSFGKMGFARYITEHHTVISWDRFWECLDNLKLAVFKSQDSDYMKIMVYKKQIHYTTEHNQKLAERGITA